MSRLFRLVGYIAGFVALFIFITLTVFYIYRNELTEKLLLRFNQLQQGKLSFSEIHVSPFVHFPSTSIHLKNVVYLDKSSGNDAISADTIAAVADLYAAFKPLQLIRGDVEVSKLTLGNGLLNLVIFPDGMLNLQHVFSASQQEPGQKLQELSAANENNQKKNKENIALKKITLENIQVRLNDSVAMKQGGVLITSLAASIEYADELIHCRLNTNFAKLNFLMAKVYNLNNKTITLNFAFDFDLHKEMFNIEPGKLIIEDAEFNFKGTLSPKDKGEIELAIYGDDKKLNFFKHILSKQGMKNLKSGSVFFDGTIKGKLKGQLPEMVFNFGLQDVNLIIPNTKKSFSQLSFNGLFKSGINRDFSGASIKISDLKGNLPGGALLGNLLIQDFANPRINLNLDMQMDVQGFDDVFNFSNVDSLDGNIILKSNMAADFSENFKKLDVKENETTLEIDSLNFVIKGFNRISNLNSTFEVSGDALKINKMAFKAGHSDFQIVGSTGSLFTWFLNENQVLQTRLSIQSDIIDLPGFLAFEPKVRQVFPYKATGVELHCDIETTYGNLTNFEFVPKIDIKLSDSKTAISGLFPVIGITSGILSMQDKEEGFNLHFTDFILEAGGGEVHANVDYFSPLSGPEQLAGNAILSQFNPGYFWAYADSVPKFTDGVINTDINFDLKLGSDSTNYESINFSARNFQYLNHKDTIVTRNLTINASKIYYPDVAGQNPTALISGKIKVNGEDIRFGKFQTDSLSLTIVAENGTFKISPQYLGIFGKEGKGLFILKPFADVPQYQLQYDLKEIPMEALLKNIGIDSLMTGLMDLHFEIDLASLDKQNLMSGMNGQIRMEGHDLFIRGIDVDNMIKKFQRTQRFSLVDAGAVLLAGPIGLAVTKGSEMANLAIGSRGDQSHVVHLVSDWKMAAGKMEMIDVAFATDENRVAGKGWVNLVSDSLDVAIAVLDINGCSVISQSIFGNLKKPEKSEVKVVKTVIAPLTNLINGALGKDCEAFYNGRIEAPVDKDK
jgi:hypothetical protein